MALSTLRSDDLHETSGPAMSTPVKSAASILAIICSLGSFMVYNAAGKFTLVILAVVFGLVGMMRAVSPRVSGGILSMLAIVIAMVGLIAAILDVIGVF